MVLTPKDAKTQDKLKSLENLIDGMLVINKTFVESYYLNELNNEQRESLFSKYNEKGWSIKFIFSGYYKQHGYRFNPVRKRAK